MEYTGFNQILVVAVIFSRLSVISAVRQNNSDELNLIADSANHDEKGSNAEGLPKGIDDPTEVQSLNASNSSTQLVEHKKERVCRGTRVGLTHTEKELDRYNLYKAIYTNCTYVDGNLELVFLQDHDLSFLKDIKEVTGYVLIVANEVDYIPLSSLMIIRGRTLFEYDQKYYSLYVALNYVPNEILPSTVGLRELRFTNLQEIMAGNVFFFDNRMLCLENAINWKDIITGEGAIIVKDNVVPNRTCELCDESCPMLNGVRHCWGSGSDQCQKLTKLTCSPQCDGRCFGPLPNQCCHPECVAGCDGPSKGQCWACKNFNNEGNCENYCPPETIYSPKYYMNVPNPNAKYAYGALCVDKCPPHLMADRGACVEDCGAGRIVGKEGKCVECDGPCPKTCKIDLGSAYINSNNIHRYTGCTIVQGSIKVLHSTFTNDTYLNVLAMRVEDLSVLETVQEVTDFVQIQGNQANFRTLSFLKNLKIIHGRRLASGASLQIFQTSLQSLGLESLEKIRFGTVFISNNSRLCYADSINWENIRERSNQKLIIEHNRNTTACVADNEVCSSECTDEGCWGPDQHQCRSCKNLHLDKQCMSTCAVTGVYQASSTQCKHCHPECKSNCTGEGADRCDDCRNARDGPYCVSECPKSKYRDENSVCQMCHSNCEGGCTGPRNTVGEQGCNSCSLVEFSDDGSEVSFCLTPESNCSDGFYKVVLSSTEERGLAGKQACKKCHPQCKTCIGNGHSFCTSCKHVQEGGKCVSECSPGSYLDADTQTCLSCDSRCLGCTGPSAAKCIDCKEYKVYVDYDNKITNRTFSCTDHCPEDLPYDIEESLDGTDASERICAREDPDNLRRKRILCIGVAGGISCLLTILIITIFVLRRRCRSQHNKQKLRDKMISAEVSAEPVFPSEARPDMASLNLVNEEALIFGRSIGSGAFGTVYKGALLVDPKTSNQFIDVAIKVLREGTSSQTKELLEEARIMASVNHPCCTKILAVCLSKDVRLITKLLRRGCMLDYIRRTPGLGSESLLLWCKQIAEGMHYLECKQIVHRDLAARNVLVESREQVKITDFGLAKLLIDEEQIRFSGGKMPIKWLALECLNQRIFTHKTDVWSYGVTIWELLTFGDRPYDQMKTAEIPAQLEQGMRLPKPKFCRDPVYDLMKRCWNKDPDMRPSFKGLVIEFEDMMRNPEHYLDLQRHDLRPNSSANDGLSRLVSFNGRVDATSVDTYLEPKALRSSARSNHSTVISSHDDDLADDVFDADTGTLTEAPGIHYANDPFNGFNGYTRQDSKLSQNSSNRSYPVPKTDFNNRDERKLTHEGFLQKQVLKNNLGRDLLTRSHPAGEAGPREGTPVWTRRQDGGTSGGRVGSASNDDYLQPRDVHPVQHVDLLNGLYHPAQNNGALRHTSGSRHPDTISSSTLPKTPDRQQYSERNPFLANFNLPVRVRQGSRDFSDTDRSSSTLEDSEPDYYNDFGEPLSAVPLLPPRIESPV